MKILYAIQGTGNGHLSRARDIIPILEKKGDLDILISGTQADVALTQSIHYNYKGLGFIFGKTGGVDIINTYLKNRSRRFYNEVKSLPIKEYDIVLNDFEPVSAWAAQIADCPCIGLSHQNAVLCPAAPLPEKKEVIGKLILKYYAPVTAHYGFHFKPYAENIYTPVIRKEIRNLRITNKGHYTVYLPSYDDSRIIKVLSKIKYVRWEVFSKHNKHPVSIQNINIKPIDNKLFMDSLATCTGILCGAGFETPAESLFLNKKLMVIPMKGQYEQQCNAAALREMGIPVIKTLKKKHIETIERWIGEEQTLEVEYPDITEEIIDRILDRHRS